MLKEIESRYAELFKIKTEAEEEMSNLYEKILFTAFSEFTGSSKSCLKVKNKKNKCVGCLGIGIISASDTKRSIIFQKIRKDGTVCQKPETNYSYRIFMNSNGIMFSNADFRNPKPVSELPEYLFEVFEVI